VLHAKLVRHPALSKSPCTVCGVAASPCIWRVWPAVSLHTALNVAPSQQRINVLGKSYAGYPTNCYCSIVL
jgi:hypothetical protein